MCQDKTKSDRADSYCSHNQFAGHSLCKSELPQTESVQEKEKKKVTLITRISVVCDYFPFVNGRFHFKRFLIVLERTTLGPELNLRS